MPKSTQQLVDEHKLILRVLDATETTLDRTRDGDLPVAFLRDVVTFSRSYIDACHHGKEEGCLFPCLAQQGIPTDSGPIQSLMEEHVMGRELVAEIAATLDGYERGEASRDEAEQPARAYIAMLRDHIEKEDAILPSMGEDVLADADDADAMRCYDDEEADHTEHDAMVRLAEDLERRAAG
jgi:hemerythrin-like domain-containing protein